MEKSGKNDKNGDNGSDKLKDVKVVEPKKFLFVSYDALISDIAWQVVKEGHEAKYFIREVDDKDIADGFVPKTNDWEKEVAWADIVVFDDVLGHGKFAEDVRKKGKLVVGGTSYTDQLEDDRSFGQEELKKYGISIIPYGLFTSFDDAIKFVKENPNRYVIKPSGEAQNVKGMLFVGEEDDGRDVIQVLNDYKQAWIDKMPSFQLQRTVVGVEVAVGAFFNGTEFVYPINVNFEHKKLFPGNLGPSTGEMGTSMFWSGPNKIFNQTLKKFEPKLAEEKYVGYIDLNCIVNGNGIYPLEFTARFGYPTIFIQSEGINMPMGEFLYGLAAGTLKTFKAKSGFQVGVRIVVPPFPFTDPETFNVKSKDSIIHFKKENRDGVHIEDVKLVHDEWVVTGTSGVILVVCGTGQTMKQAQNQAYARIRNIVIPHMYYRYDIGDRWFDDSDKLHNWGYLREV
ncbi:MAG: phosphoribosylglycinamide synthetase C domain-containing protein [Nanoarchaeota archaeon]